MKEILKVGNIQVFCLGDTKYFRHIKCRGPECNIDRKRFKGDAW